MDDDKKIEWRNWVVENREKGANDDTLRKQMKTRDVDLDTIMKDTGVSDIERYGRALARGVTKGVGNAYDAVNWPQRAAWQGASALADVVSGKGVGLGTPPPATIDLVQEHVTGPFRKPESTGESITERGGELLPGMAVPGSWPLKAAAVALGAGGGELGKQSGMPYAEELATIAGSVGPDILSSGLKSISAVNQLKKSGIKPQGGEVPMPAPMVPADKSEMAAQALSQSIRHTKNPEASRTQFTQRQPRKALIDDLVNAIDPKASNMDELAKITNDMYTKFRGGGGGLKTSKKFRDWVNTTPEVRRVMKGIADTMTNETVESLLKKPTISREIIEDLRLGLSKAAETSPVQRRVRELSQDVTKRSNSPLLGKAVDQAGLQQQANTAATKVDKMMNPRMERSALDSAVKEAIGTSSPGMADKIENVYRPMARTNAAARTPKAMGDTASFLGAGSAAAARAGSRATFEAVRETMRAMKLRPGQAEKATKAFADGKHPLWKELEQLQGTPGAMRMAIRAAIAAETSDE